MDGYAKRSRAVSPTTQSIWGVKADDGTKKMHRRVIIMSSTRRLALGKLSTADKAKESGDDLVMSLYPFGISSLMMS